MVQICCVKGCRSENFANCGISFHRFPKNENLRKKWLEALGGNNINSKNPTVCSRHFKQEDYKPTILPRLKDNVIPHVVIEYKMNRKRNVSFIKPEDPHFLKILKKEAGYDNSNHKFDKLDNAEEDFVDDEDSELPQVVVLRKGDLTAEEAELEKERIKQVELETKADLSQKVIFKAKTSKTMDQKKGLPKNKQCKVKNKQKLLSFVDEAFSDSDT